ncbi:TCF25/Rqc1 [Dillenia turbinata]|uniref:TCF25/Rqc1 n=1 Tax=Dillenia turbinata TaxID=194707 RepID=A0AAN8W765_9MAGN
MSARLLKKVLQEQEEEKQVALEGDDASESPDSSSPSPSPCANPFDLLGLEENESEVAEESSGQDVNDQETDMARNVSMVAPSAILKSKKKKKKKSILDPVSPEDKVDKRPESDNLLESLCINEKSSTLKPTKGGSANAKDHDKMIKHHKSSILAVDSKYLSAENELRRIFGSKVVSSFEKSNQSGTFRQIRGGRRGSHNPRKTLLVSPSDHWPRWDGSLSMELLESREGQYYFRYVHSNSYAEAQRAFEAAKAIHDLNGIASILMNHPYHIDSLTTMADYFKFVGEHQMSADAIAKCLYALECAWHPMFNPLTSNCQVKHCHETNKPLFYALFTHMKNMDRRGCHRSALEVCKFLLSLDSDDPMGALFCIDYYALRAEEYAWLELFSEEYNTDTSLWLFPNFSYSLAICRSYLEHNVSSDDVHMGTGKATSIELMKQALMLHPSVLKKMVAKVPLKDRLWQNILKHASFQTDHTGSPALDHLINIYVERSYIIWRLPQVQKLVKDAVLLVESSHGNDAKDWACVRKEAFSLEKNEYSHLLISDFSDSVPTMPPEMLQNVMVNPRVREVQNGNQAANLHEGANDHRDLANQNILGALFESLLPWVHYGGNRQQGDGRANENGQLDGPEANNGG